MIPNDLAQELCLRGYKTAHSTLLNAEANHFQLAIDEESCIYPV